MDDDGRFDRRNAFEIIEPDRHVAPLVFNSPHSGSRYPAAFLAASHLDERTIRRSEDTFVDELFLTAREHGAPLLRTHFPRAWLDVNREPYELDPKLLDGVLPPFANIHSARVVNGLGTVPRLVADGKAIYPARIAVAEALARIEHYYLPYHQCLQALIDRTRDAFGFAVLVDCHSMPSSVRTTQFRGRPDVVLGDRHGSSCDGTLTDLIETTLVRRGYDVSRNRPYAGGYITEHYGKPERGVHAIQIEINRSLYLDERTLRKSRGYTALATDLEALVAELVRGSADLLGSPREAAE